MVRKSGKKSYSYIKRQKAYILHQNEISNKNRFGQFKHFI